MNETLIQMQIVWFFKDDYTNNFEKLSLEIKNLLGEPKISQYIPIPSDAPSNLPRLTLVYDKFNINIAKNRADLFIDNNDTELINKISNTLIDKSLILIGRVAMVKTIFLDGNINDLKNNLADDKKSIDLKEITIRINREKLINNYKCNNIEIINTGFVEDKITKIKKHGIIVMRDINTLSEELKSYSFSKEGIESILKEFDTESKIFILLKK